MQMDKNTYQTIIIITIRPLREFIERKIAQGPQMRYVGRNNSMVV